ncbi:hypothetical protein PS619_05311 [Pseudomonas fluorescens]|nr:hypothetical protein PS619_05311 [Pseudomonas fluorescens]
MHQFLQIAAGVVRVGLGVVEAVVRVGGFRQVGNVRERAVVVTSGADQSVQRVVAEITVTVDQLVGEIDRLEGVVFDAGNVADGVVEVFEVLQHCAGVFATGLSVQTTIGRVVGPATEDKITGLLLDDLVGSVVLRIKQHGPPLALVLDQQLYLPKVPGQAITRFLTMAAGIGLLQHGAHRAEHTTAGEALAIVKGTDFGQRLTGEGEAVGAQGTRVVVLLQQLSASIEPGIGAGIGVGKHIDIGHAVFFDGDYAQLLIESRAPMTVALVPALHRFAGQARQDQAPAGVNAVRFQRLAVQAVHRGQARHRQAWIPLCRQLPARVVLLTVDQWRGCVLRHSAQINHLTSRQTAAIVHRKRRRAPIQ